jgi:hydroxymethylglutaryl-CoA lyase
MNPSLPDEVLIVEVGPRDGLQNEPTAVPTETKVAFIDRLAEAGLRQIEITSFVHPRAVPQLADAEEVARRIARRPGVFLSALVPNAKGLERARACGLKRIAVFTGATDGFTQKNINVTMEESLDLFRPLVRAALAEGISVRGYLSVCFVCPFEGNVPKSRVREMTERLLELGVDQVALSDTLGAAAPTDIRETVGFVLQAVPPSLLALHLHDTYGTALANVLAGLELGITTFDASAGGLGGCPFAPGASGNLATEDLVYMLERMGIQTGINAQRVVEAATLVADSIGRDLPSRNGARLRRRASAQDGGEHASLSV